MASHLYSLQKVANSITHDGNALNNFESDYLREPLFNWNPPSCNTLTAICKDDEQTDNNNYSFDEENSQAINNINIPAGVVSQVVIDYNHKDYDDVSFIEVNPQAVVNHNDINRTDGVVPQAVVEVTPPYHELLLRNFTNNYELIA